MSNSRRLVFSHATLLILGLFALSACKPDYASLAEQARAKIDQAQSAAEAGEDQRAIDLITEAFQAGGLARGETMTAGHRIRAISRARLGDYPGAIEDVQALQETGSLAEALVLNSFILRKQGRMAEAKAAYNRAKSLDRSVQPIVD